MADIVESSRAEFLVDCSSLPPGLQSGLEDSLSRHPEVHRLVLRSRVPDSILSGDATGLIFPRFDIVVYLSEESLTSLGPQRSAALIKKWVDEWVIENKPRGQKNENVDLATNVATVSEVK